MTGVCLAIQRTLTKQNLSDNILTVKAHDRVWILTDKRVSHHNCLGQSWGSTLGIHIDMCIRYLCVNVHSHCLLLTLYNTDAEFTPHVVNVTSETGLYGKEKWGYSHVRQGAYMFWWLKHTTHTQGYQNRPLIIWLQVGTYTRLQVAIYTRLPEQIHTYLATGRHIHKATRTDPCLYGYR